MNKVIPLVTAAVVLASLVLVASAQAEDAPGKKAPTQAAKDKALSDDMTASLRKAGFTDLHVMPNSILVRAKDKAGNAVAMVLNPGSMTEMVMLDPHSGSAAGGNGATPAPLTGSGTFATVLPTARLASTLIGLTVHNATDEIGTIKDLAIDHDGVHAYIVAVGGVLGIGNRYVAVTPSAITLVYDHSANSYRATMNATDEQMKAAPAFAYEGSFKAGRE